ncbi:MAG: hypothetical protein CSA44_01760 [Gammaproteobacteria bacterium]|nr:MAG: hypothetical protein CSA44_01760 [Gammaproteobacteria bacterium]
MTREKDIAVAKELLALPLDAQKAKAKRAGMPFDMWKELVENQANGMIGLLDLPMEKQLASAKGMGFDNYDDWVEYIKKTEIEMDEHIAKFKWGVRPDGFTDEDVKRAQEKVDSSYN